MTVEQIERAILDLYSSKDNINWAKKAAVRISSGFFNEANKDTLLVSAREMMPKDLLDTVEDINVKGPEGNSDLKQPPLGLTPRAIYDRVITRARLKDVLNAMMRYQAEGEVIPIEWVEEYNELIEALK